MARQGTQRDVADSEEPGLTSLLWPPEYPPSARTGIRLTQETFGDLDLEPIVGALGTDRDRAAFARSVLMNLCPDPTVITYRADVLANLLDDARLRERLTALTPQLHELVRDRRKPVFDTQWTIGDVVRRLGELDLYVEVALALADALEGGGVRAPALRALRASVKALIDTPNFQSLQEELPILRETLEGVKSVTVGINLSDDLQPESATVLSVDTERVEGRRVLLERLLGPNTSGRGMTPLRGTQPSAIQSVLSVMARGRGSGENDLVHDLRRLLEGIVAPIGEAIERYVWAHTRDFVGLDAELSFLLSAASLIDRMRQAGLPMCRPSLAADEERLCQVEAGYCVSLALRMAAQGAAKRIVTNEITFDDATGRVWILTGPNRGGKTTYTRAVGQTYVLFQAGLFVCGSRARMSPIDALYTHFPSRESATPGEGRLDDEAARLSGIFREATPSSLILLNEVLSGTSTVEALGLAHDAVRGLRLLGARAIYVTHLHELAMQVDEINRTTPGDATVASLVAEADAAAGSVEGPRRSFRITPAPPAGVSYASEIAEQHGISYGQLLRLLEERGVLHPEEVRGGSLD